MSFQIHFQLQEIEKIIPFGEQRDSMHWYALTDGFLWISAGTQTVFTYSQDARDFWNCPEVEYYDYQLAQFTRDFSRIFNYLAESVPEEIYQHLEDFVSCTEKWETLHENLSDEDFEIWYDTEFAPLTEWFYQEFSFDTGYLTGGCQVGCFRCGENLKFWWDNYGRTLENHKNIWNFPKGCYEMPYDDFVQEVQRFFQEFSCAMQKQVNSALQKEWGSVRLDKQQLVSSQEQNLQDFQQKLALLSQPVSVPHDWNQILTLWQKCLSEI